MRTTKGRPYSTSIRELRTEIGPLLSLARSCEAETAPRSDLTLARYARRTASLLILDKSVEFAESEETSRRLIRIASRIIGKEVEDRLRLRALGSPRRLATIE